MKISLIYTESEQWAIGIRCRSAFLREAGYRPRLILMNSDEIQYSERTLNQLNDLVSDSDIIGISCFSQGSDRAKKVLQHINDNGKITVWGGLHATLNPSECADYADMVCVGEGEEFMLELVERLDKGFDWKDVRNGAYRENGQTIYNELRPLIANLDSLPLPDFTFEDEFHLTGEELRKADTISEGPDGILYSGGRGCAFHCTYCTNAKLKKIFSGKGKWARSVSPQKLVAHAAMLKEIFPDRRYFYFLDEDFLARGLDDIREFSALYHEKVNLPFEFLE